MLISTNITNARVDTDRYRDAADYYDFCKRHGLDGLELLPAGVELSLNGIPRELIVGVHLPFLPNWYDFWMGNEAALLREFGNADTVRTVYGGDTPTILLNSLRGALDFARELNARYVVFHVSNATLNECFTYRFTHSDEQICRAAAELINAALNGRDDSFDFLVENLWWPGLTLTRPEVTRELMESIRTARKGIMLDTGHMMHTNRNLRDQCEAIAYIHRQLDEHASLCWWIKGMHLHQSLSGEYVNRILRQLHPEGEDYRTRSLRSIGHVLQIDRHEPFSVPEVRGLVERLAPEYLTHEFITNDLAQHDEVLHAQCKALSG